MIESWQGVAWSHQAWHAVNFRGARYRIGSYTSDRPNYDPIRALVIRTVTETGQTDLVLTVAEAKAFAVELIDKIQYLERMEKGLTDD